ncbi:MAG: VPLPA-CTERM sorting domain-containing protein [Pseudomonadota bacterium]
MSLKVLASAAAILAGGSAAYASTITISSFTVGTYSAELAGFSSPVVEDFEAAQVGNVSDGFSTAVGTFATIGGTGTGGTVSQANFANDGSKLAIRDGNVFGRVSTTQLLTGNAADDQFLDSNDTFGIAWTASLGGTLFDKLLLTLTDAADVGARMRVSTGLTTETLVTAGNGNQQMVLVEFSSAVSSASIFFENVRDNGNLTNDGFSLDDIAISAVPLPAGALLLGSALVGLMGARRRKTV